MTDQKIIDLYFARNEKAILETERAHGAFCMGVSMSILNNRMDAEECVNDTYLKAWNAIPPTIPRSLRAFLAKIVRNLSIDRYREKRVERPTVELEAAMAELSACIPTEAEQAEAVALGVAGAVAPDEALHQLLGGDIQHLGGDVLQGDQDLLLLSADT